MSLRPLRFTFLCHGSSSCFTIQGHRSCLHRACQDQNCQREAGWTLWRIQTMLVDELRGWGTQLPDRFSVHGGQEKGKKRRRVMEASHARHCLIVVIPLSSSSCFLVRVDVGLGSLSARYTLTERRIADAASACRQNDTLSLPLSLSLSVAMGQEMVSMVTAASEGCRGGGIVHRLHPRLPDDPDLRTADDHVGSACSAAGCARLSGEIIVAGSR